MYHLKESQSAATLMSRRSERRSSKNMTNCSLKKTSGSTLGLPHLAYSGVTSPRTNDRSSAFSRRR
jgi:hypothetical protein